MGAAQETLAFQFHRLLSSCCGPRLRSGYLPCTSGPGKNGGDMGTFREQCRETDCLTSTKYFDTEQPATEMVRRNKKHVCHIACPGKCSSHVRVSAPRSQHLAQKWSIPGIHFLQIPNPSNWAPPIQPELSTGGKERGHSPSENQVKSKHAGPKAAP